MEKPRNRYITLAVLLIVVLVMFVGTILQRL